MKSNILKALLLVVITALITVIIQLYFYYENQYKNFLLKDFCYNNCNLLSNTNRYEKQKINEICTSENNEKTDCYNKMSELMLPQLLIYKAYIDGKPLKFVHYDNQSTYKVPIQAVEKTDVLIGYGIAGKCNFENMFSKLFKKTSYGFDCGVSKEETNCKECNFENECITTDKFLVENQKSSKKVHIFGEKLKQLNLEDKKIYIKMDIAGAEKEAIPDILKYSNNITAISIAVHTEGSKEIINTIEMLKLLNKDFILVSRSFLAKTKSDKKVKPALKYTKGNDLKGTVILTYINKNIADKYYLKLNQTSKSNYIDLIKNKPDNIDYEPYSNITWQVVVFEKLRKLFNINYA